MHRLALATLAAAALACGGGARAGAARGTPPPVELGEAAGREVLARFCSAVEASRWDEAHALLSARWRALYTPSRLARDRAGAGPAAGEAAGRVLAALAAGAPLTRRDGRALLPVGAGRAAVLVPEEGRWRVDALE